MAPVRPQRQRVDVRDQCQIEITIQMGKERATARRLPLQTVSQRYGVNAHQQQIALPGEMLRGGLGNLRSAGKMNETISAVDLRAAKDTGAFGFAPQWGRTNFVEYRHRAESGSGPH